MLKETVFKILQKIGEGSMEKIASYLQDANEKDVQICLEELVEEGAVKRVLENKLVFYRPNRVPIEA